MLHGSPGDLPPAISGTATVLWGTQIGKNSYSTARHGSFFFHKLKKVIDHVRK